MNSGIFFQSNLFLGNILNLDTDVISKITTLATGEHSDSRDTINIAVRSGSVPGKE